MHCLPAGRAVITDEKNKDLSPVPGATRAFDPSPMGYLPIFQTPTSM